VGTWSAIGPVNGFGLRKVVNDLVAAFCCRVCRNIDFQQANGRNVGVKLAMVFDVREVMFELKHQP